MSTLTQRKPRVKPARFVRLELRPFEGNPGVVRITVGKEVQDYMLLPLPSDFGSAYRLTKIGTSEGSGDQYDVNLNGRLSSCECKGHIRHHRCKHVDGLHKLIEVGQLPAGHPAKQTA